MRFLGEAVTIPPQLHFREIWLMLALLFCAGASYAQALRTATPVRVDLITATSSGFSPLAPTVTVPPSATAPGPALLEARESAGRVNVRALPDPDSDVMGTIASGTRYRALRRYYLWIELSFDPAPDGRAWVFSELVDVSGDEAGIAIIEDFADVIAPASSFDEASAEADQPDEAESRTLIIATALDDSAAGDWRQTPLPTYTYPPGLRLALPTDAATKPDEAAAGAANPTRVPPLLPIALLAGIGMVGLIVSGIRQL